MASLPIVGTAAAVHRNEASRLGEINSQKRKQTLDGLWPLPPPMAATSQSAPKPRKSNGHGRARCAVVAEMCPHGPNACVRARCARAREIENLHALLSPCYIILFISKVTCLNVIRWVARRNDAASLPHIIKTAIYSAVQTPRRCYLQF